MKIAVFGANGKVGSQVVAMLLARGHSVRGFIHGNPPVVRGDHEYIQGDVYNSSDVTRAIEGCEAIISCLGSWGTPKKDILASGMKNIVPAMQAHAVTRIISLTGADAATDMDHRSILQKVMHTVFGILAGKILHDGEEHLRVLAASGTDWTVLRSPVMNEKGTDGYALSRTYPLPWRTIHRHAVATALCDQLEDTEHYQEAPYLYRG